MAGRLQRKRPPPPERQQRGREQREGLLAAPVGSWAALRPAARLFVYYCPESAPVKAKMTYSTAKATFADILSHPHYAFCGVVSLHVRPAKSELHAGWRADLEKRRKLRPLQLSSRSLGVQPK